MRRIRNVVAVLATAAASACASAMNHTDLAGPRYARAVTPVVDSAPMPERLRVVTFNVAFSYHVDSAIALLQAEPYLQNPDLLFLQEMDEAAVQRIADAVGGGYVYYPATKHFKTHRDFGNAIVSRWPIEADRKIILPHLARIGGTQRIAVGATLRIGGRGVRVYSVHLATMIGNGPGARRDQMRAVLADADSFPVVIIAGDFNSETVPEMALQRGYAWPTRTLPPTNGMWTFDHVLVKGIPSAATAEAGTVESARGASDHRPVWALLDLQRVTYLTGSSR